MKMKLNSDHQSSEFDVFKIQNELWLHIDGKTIVVPYEKVSNKKKLAGKSAAALGLLSPMPGKITKILKSVDSAVKAGEVILVMEAMKMEYSLKADHDVIIEKMNVSAGQQVVLGAVLVQFKKGDS